MKNLPAIAQTPSRLQHITHHLCRSTAALPSSDKGGVAAMVGLAVVPMVLALGLAIDGGLAYGAHSKLQGAVDAAALAGARVASSEDGNVEADARMFFDANFPSSFLGGQITDFDANFDEDTGELRIDAEIDLPTSFMRIAGLPTVSVAASAVAQQQLSGLELAMVLDITGSMNKPDPSGGTKIQALKDASETLLDVIYGENETVNDVSISVVPYNTQVNLGSDRTDLLTGFDVADFGDDGWKGCVEARTSPSDLDDTTPSTEAFSALLSPTGAPNAHCQDSEVLPLTAEKSVISDHIDDLEAEGFTFTNVGFTWGWRTISPLWDGVWGTDSDPVAYDHPTIQKAIIFMTDGVAVMPKNRYTAYGFLNEGRLGTTNKKNAEVEINDRLLQTCELAKAEGLEVYTVMFALDDPTVEADYRTCASSEEHFFDAPDGDQLDAAFRQIAGRLTSLRLTE